MASFLPFSSSGLDRRPYTYPLRRVVSVFSNRSRLPSVWMIPLGPVHLTDPKRSDRMATQKPNVLVMWGDDIGQSNLSCYTRGMMGYKTPNIDRLADEGMLFTDLTRSRAAPRAARRLSPGSAAFAPASPRSVFPVRSWASRPRTSPSRKRSSRLAIAPASSARTTSVTATSTCRRCTVLTSSSATCIT